MEYECGEKKLDAHQRSVGIVVKAKAIGECEKLA